MWWSSDVSFSFVCWSSSSLSDVLDESDGEVFVKLLYTFNNENELINKYIEEIKDSIRDICADDLKDVKPTDLYKHAIELTSIKPFQEKMRPIPVAKKQEFIIANGMLVGLVDELISPINKFELKNLYTWWKLML